MSNKAVTRGLSLVIVRLRAPLTRHLFVLFLRRRCRVVLQVKLQFYKFSLWFLIQQIAVYMRRGGKKNKQKTNKLLRY